MNVSTRSPRREVSGNERAVFDGLVRRAFESQSTLRNQREHCSLDPERLAAIGLEVGSQIRVRRNSDEIALYTVSEAREESIDNTVRMARVARERLGTTDEFDALIDTQVPHPTLSDSDAQEESEFVERLQDDSCQQGLVCVAPHGGMIEPTTDRQAERVASRLGADRASVWLCKGFKTGGGAKDAWHITSSALQERSFPLLKTIIARGFAHAVAFHGFSSSGVLVGGAAPPTLKQEIAEALARALAGSGIEVRIAGPSDPLDGDSPSNIVNRLTAGGTNGIQLEQSRRARNGFWQAIADAVVSVYDAKLP